jgi:chemotaxis protein MotB
MGGAQKTKITCFECNTTFMFDKSRLAPDAQEKQCFKCGAAIPLVDRILRAKNKPGEVLKLVIPPPDSKEKKEEAVDYAQFLFQGGVLSDTGAGYTDTDDGASWLATYGDIMSLLLIFFILLFAISSIDRKKFEAVMSSISTSLGGNVTFVEVPVSTKEQTIKLIKTAMEQERVAMTDLYGRLATFLAQNRLEDKIALSDENENLVLMAKGMAMFDSGSAELREEILPDLKKLSEILKNIDNTIIVEGHTDDVPIRTARFPSNWELSSSRAANVVHFLIDECLMRPQRLSVAGYSHYKNRFGFDTPEGKRNRRIEILVRKKYSTALTDEFLLSQ